MKVLAIDTGSGTSVAAAELTESGFIVAAFVNTSDPFSHAENIGVSIAECLNHSGWQESSDFLVVANNGPAAYTGLRVGLAAAAGFAFARGLGTAGVSSLQAAALSAFESDPNLEECTVALEAKRRELFVQNFLRGRIPVPVDEPHLVPIQPNPSSIPLGWITKAPDASSIAHLALLQLESGEVQPLLPALYLRSPDVTPSSGKRVTG